MQMPLKAICSACAVLVAAGAASAQQSPSSQSQSRSTFSAGYSAWGGIIQPGMSYVECKGAGSECLIKVTVTVDSSDTSGETCSFILPQVVVVFDPNITIKWQLDNSTAGTEFTVRGIKVRRAALDRLDIVPITASAGQEFKWKSTNAKFRVFAYDVNVKNSNGVCDTFDPIIINRG